LWCRKRIDIGWGDLAAGMAGVLFSRNRKRPVQRISEAWQNDGRSVLACLSVRSGWDAVLQALRLPPGGEVLMSAMTIPDMAGIVEAHNLVPVPLELDRATAFPTPEVLRQAITERSKIVLAAHLFGGRFDVEPLIDIAHEHGLLFVEDCAQAFVGANFAGHPRSDLSLFSFGTIKTRTGLGGGVLHFRDPDLFQATASIQSAYPVQPRGKYFQRLLKYSGLKFLSQYPVFAGFIRYCRWRGIDHNLLLNSSVRGFASADGWERFRRQPSAPMLRLLARRIPGDGSRRLARQQRLGRELWKRIREFADCPGISAKDHCFWVFPVLANEPRELIALLAENGFDATQGESMRIIERPHDSPALEPDAARQLLEKMVYVPLYAELSNRALVRLGDVLVDSFSPTERLPDSEPSLQNAEGV